MRLRLRPIPCLGLPFPVGHCAVHVPGTLLSAAVSWEYRVTHGWGQSPEAEAAMGVVGGARDPHSLLDTWEAVSLGSTRPRPHLNPGRVS